MRQLSTRMRRGRSPTGIVALGVKSGAIAALLLAAAAPALAAGTITIEEPWMRMIIKARPAAGYFTLHNDTDKSLELTGATSTACGMVMLHQSTENNGIEKMRPVKSINVAPHSTLSFHPGGYHIMCMEPQSAMAVGKSVPVTLKFADGETVDAQFPVIGPGASAPSSQETQEKAPPASAGPAGH